MDFPARLIQLRREQNLTQQALADAVSIHVNQIRRYEAGSAQPTLEALTKLARALHVSLDSLVFGDNARGPDEDFRLRFEALKDFTPDERNVAREILDSLILKHAANRFSPRQEAARAGN
ncbi:MAG: helix-turn-helix domain-containing protein [Pseudomonadota bacterium]